MDVQDVVRQHYSGADLAEQILTALAAAGVATETLTVEELAGVDQLHAGFLPATRYLLEQLALSPDTALLDVGSGLGGPTRLAAHLYGSSVTGVDLSPDFVRAAAMLTERVGLASLVRHVVSPGERLDLPDASFDRAMMVHVGMNIADKRAVFAEVRRTLRPGALFALYEQLRTSAEPLTYPLPWAVDETSSFVGTPEEYEADLQAAGFAVERRENRASALAGPAPGSASALSPVAVFGPQFAARLANNLAAVRAGSLAPVLLLARPV